MARVNPIITSFNAGELSPWIAGRPDVAKYGNGCRTLQGFIPMVEGPIFARGGIRHVGEVKTSTARTWLMRFEFSVDDAYMIEFGNLYARFYFNRAQVLSGGVPYEIATPYTTAALTNPDGSFALKFAQTGDVIRITGGGKPPQTLTRLAPTNWTIADTVFNPPPFAPLNATATTVYASAVTGAVTLTASTGIFSASHVGRYIYLGEKDVRDNKLWETAKAVGAGVTRRSDGKNYKSLNAATTGSVKPTHTEGSVYDGDSGVQWEFQDAGYGWAKIDGFTDSTHVSATVVSQIPIGAVGVGNPSDRWAFDAWSAADGYPTSVTFFRERLVYARDSTLWFSVSADFVNFAYEVAGQVTADAAFDRTISSDRANSIRWLSPDDILLVGTVGDEWACTKATTSDPFGPANCEIKRQSTYGSSFVQPARVGNVTLFMQRSGRKCRAMEFRFEKDGFQSDNVCAFARHITQSGVVDIAYQQEPYSLVWMARADGVLVACTFDREQDVVAWHKHPISGGIVECVECIPSPDGGRDDAWVITRFTVNGVTKRYIGYIEAEADLDTLPSDWFYVDYGLTYSGPPADVISGLDHLEGKSVWVLVDGARHPDRIVSGGSITLQLEGSKVHVGLPSEAIAETMDIEAGTANGTSQGKTRRAPVVTARVLNSAGGTAGPDVSSLEDFVYRTPQMNMNEAPPAFTGDVDIEWPADYDTSLRLVIKKDRPMPFTLVALMPQIVGSEGR